MVGLCDEEFTLIDGLGKAGESEMIGNWAAAVPRPECPDCFDPEADACACLEFAFDPAD